MKNCMTEGEAHGTYCPCKLNKSEEEDRMCEASYCMAWRVTVVCSESKTLLGYCGLAGKP
jgi:hypothetical protein